MDFFNDLSREVGRVFRSVTRSKEGAEGEKPQPTVESAREQAEKSFADLGRAYLCSVQEGTPLDPALLEAAEEARNQLEQLLAEQAWKQRQRRCPACGSLMPWNARFCCACGKPMPEDRIEPEEALAKAEYCPDCRAMRIGSDRFCSVCGHDYRPDVPESEPTTQAEPIVSTVGEYPSPLEEPEEMNLQNE